MGSSPDLPAGRFQWCNSSHLTTRIQSGASCSSAQYISGCKTFRVQLLCPMLEVSIFIEVQSCKWIETLFPFYQSFAMESCGFLCKVRVCLALQALLSLQVVTAHGFAGTLIDSW